MGKRIWSVYGVKNRSVPEASKVLGDKLNLLPRRFQVDYTTGDNGFVLSEVSPLYISVMRNYAHTPHGTRCTYWYEEKFKEYPVMIYVSAESDRLEFPPAKWVAINEAFDSLDGIYCLYMKEE